MSLRDDLKVWDPMYLWQTLNTPAGHVVTADEWNNYWNLLMTQGDHSSEAIKDIRDMLYETVLSDTNGASAVKFTHANFTATDVSAALIELDTQDITDRADYIARDAALATDYNSKFAATANTISANETARNTRNTNDEQALATHKTSTDHDGRYNTKTEITNALALKANLASPTFTGTVGGITKAMVGLGNVDNTADSAKPVSIAAQALLDLKASIVQLNTHKTSSDHDERYLAKDNTEGYVPQEITHPATKGYVDETFAGATLGQIADDSLMDTKFHSNYKHGGLDRLGTTAKNNLVDAINELNARPTSDTRIGDLAVLTTTEQGSIVGAINEVNAKPTTPADDSVTNNQLATDVKIGSNATLATTHKATIVGAINEAFQFANDGKTAVANAITAKGVAASPADTFSTLATKTGQIQSVLTGTMVAGDVLAGKTGYSNNPLSKITGTMVDRGTVNITPSTANQVIPAGKHSGAGVVYGDADLVAGNILNTANIFGVQGTALSGAAIKSIQRVTVASASFAAASLALTIAAVDMSKTIVLVDYTHKSGNGQHCPKAVLTNATTVTLTKYAATVPTNDIYVTVIEFASGVSVQRVTGSYSSAATSTNVTISAVDMTKSVLFAHDGVTNATGSFSYYWKIAPFFVNSTTVTLDRGNSTYYSDYVLQVLTFL